MRAGEWQAQSALQEMRRRLEQAISVKFRIAPGRTFDEDTSVIFLGWHQSSYRPAESAATPNRNLALIPTENSRCARAPRDTFA